MAPPAHISTACQWRWRCAWQAGAARMTAGTCACWRLSRPAGEDRGGSRLLPSPPLEEALNRQLQSVVPEVAPHHQRPRLRRSQWRGFGYGSTLASGRSCGCWGRRSSHQYCSLSAILWRMCNAVCAWRRCAAGRVAAVGVEEGLPAGMAGRRAAASSSLLVPPLADPAWGSCCCWQRAPCGPTHTSHCGCCTPYLTSTRGSGRRCSTSGWSFLKADQILQDQDQILKVDPIFGPWDVSVHVCVSPSDVCTDAD